MKVPLRERPYRRSLYLTLILLFIVLLLSLLIGRYSIPPSTLLSMLYRVVRGETLGAEGAWLVFFYIRLPRILLVTGVGAMLAITGGAYQGLFKNPLVSPDILGVTAGASFGVALGLVTGGETYRIYLLAFLLGILAVALSYLLSTWSRGGGMMLMVLGGILVSSFFNALLSILKYLADPYDKLPGIVFWLMGSFSRTTWREVLITLPLIFLGMATILLVRWYLNALAMGEEEALSMGIRVGPIRLVLITFSTLMVSASVATTGQVTWIGLIIPHIARYLVGADHRYMLPMAGLLGSIFLLIMDTLARGLTSTEIPISILTALIGAPFFAHLIMTREESGWN